MSDTEAGSDYEVIPEDRAVEDARREASLRFRAMSEAMTTSEMSSSVVSSATEDGIIGDHMLNSMSHLARESPEPRPDSLTIPPTAKKMYAFADEQDEVTDEDEEDAEKGVLEAHGDIKKTLLEAIEHMDKLRNWKEEREELITRISTLEGTVDRLSLKNKNLQRISESGTLFDRRKREKDATAETDEAGKRGWSLKTVLCLLIYSLMVGLTIYYYQTEADMKIQRLEKKIRTERIDSAFLGARVTMLEKKLNSSFMEIQKLNRIIYSPYTRDIYSMHGESEEVKEIGCFIRLNTTTSAFCQRLTEELEREGHEKTRLKEQVSLFKSIVRTVAALGIGSLLFMCLKYTML